MAYSTVIVASMPHGLMVSEIDLTLQGGEKAVATFGNLLVSRVGIFQHESARKNHCEGGGQVRSS